MAQAFTTPEIVRLEEVYFVLSTATKPTNPSLYLLFEVDTGLWFDWNGTTWIAYSPPGGSAAGVASGVADSGNPMKIGGVYNLVPPTLTTGQRGNAQLDSVGNLRVQPQFGNSVWAGGPPTGDGVVASGLISGGVLAVKYSFNGTSLDRDRNNVAATLLASSSRTSIQTSADIPTYNFKALTVILDMTVVAASPSITVTINGKDPASGKYYLLLSGAAVLTAVTNVYSVGPSIAEVANVSTSKFLPAIIQIVVTHNNANAGTYSVGYNLMI